MASSLLGTLRLTPRTIVSSGRVQSNSVVGNFQLFEGDTKSLPFQRQVSNNTLIIDDELTAVNLTTLNVEKIAKLLVENPRASFPPSSTFNAITRSYSTISGGRDKSLDSIVVSQRKLEPYEVATGLSQEVPEVLLISTFKPAFNVDKSFTNVGKFLDSQIQFRSFQNVAINDLISKFRNNEDFERSFSERAKNMDDAVKKLQEVASFMLSLLKNFRDARESLDLRNDSAKIVTRDIAKIFSGNFGADDSLTLILDKVLKFMPRELAISDSLRALGNETPEFFSSTKLWMQFLYEMKSLIKHHSPGLFNVSRSKVRDKNPVIVSVKDDRAIFDLRDKDPRDLLSVAEIATVDATKLNELLSSIVNAYRSIYENGNFDSVESKLVAISNLFSKEVAYSSALSRPTVRKNLLDKWNYVVSDTENNIAVFDAVLGRFPDSVLSVPLEQLKSVASIAQESPATNVAVLPFETKYLENDQGQLTPGSIWYVDHAMSQLGPAGFDTSRVEAFVRKLSMLSSDFSTIIKQLKIVDPIMAEDSSKRTIENSLHDPEAFLNEVSQFFLDRSGVLFEAIDNDRITPIFVLANESVNVKSLLFSLLTCHLARSYDDTGNFSSSRLQDNTPLSGEIVKQLVASVKDSLKLVPNVNNSDGNLDTILPNTCHRILERGTVLMAICKSLLMSCYNAFRKINVLNDSNRTVYGGHLDTVLLMIIFDVVVSIIARFSKNKFSGYIQPRPGSNISIEFVVTSTNVPNSRDFFQLISTRLQLETSLMQRCVWTVLGTLRNVGQSLKRFSNFLNDSSTKANLAFVRSAINDDEQFKLLISEQQILSFCSTVQDSVDKMNSTQLDELSQFDDRETHLKILDDCVVPTNVRNALFSFLKLAPYSTKKALNKQVLSVGIPLNFTNKFIRTSRVLGAKNALGVDKQLDVVKLFVHKIDNLNTDIIFKPREFLFELSRFPVRSYDRYKSIKTNSSLAELLAQIPTRDFNEAFVEMSDSIGYFGGSDERQAMNSLDYSFLTRDQKTTVITNHVTSFLIELYLRLTTGIATSESSFKIQPDSSKFVEKDYVKLLVDNAIRDPRPRASMSDSAGSIFSNVTVDRQAIKQVNASTIPTRQPINPISAILEKDVPLVLQSMKSISALASLKTNLSHVPSFAKEVVKPCMFDRIFNVIVDPDDFEIDYNQTVSTPEGKEMLDQLFDRGEVTVVTKKQNGESIYKLREKDVTAGAVTFDKYFVSVGTIDEVG